MEGRPEAEALVEGFKGFAVGFAVDLVGLVGALGNFAGFEGFEALKAL